MTGIGARIAGGSLLVALFVIGLLAAGIFAVSRPTFEHLVMLQGVSAAMAAEMFRRSVTEVFLVAVALAVAASSVLALTFGSRLSRPLERMGNAARRIANGDYGARVPRGGADELASLADSLNQMAESLEQQEQTRREFIANAAHELRTPLTNLQGYLEGLRDGVIAPERAVFVSLHEEVRRLASLAQSLLLLTEGDSARPVEIAGLDLRAAVLNAVELAAPALERQRIRLEVDLPPRLSAQANPEHLSQVLSNLLNNAARYTPEGGLVRVNARARLSDVLVTVVNTADIPTNEVPHLFERFYRVDKSRDRSRGGAGIGLAIVKQLVEGSGGEVGVESSANHASFWFSLPVSRRAS